jgi:hypothetical protein
MAFANTQDVVEYDGEEYLFPENFNDYFTSQDPKHKIANAKMLSELYGAAYREKWAAIYIEDNRLKVHIEHHPLARQNNQYFEDKTNDKEGLYYQDAGKLLALLTAW